jgi:methionine sulfoxide reductase heme-binding subunit
MTLKLTLTAKMTPHLTKPYAKVILFALCLWPFADLLYAAVFNQSALGANPAEYIIRATGDWVLRFLCIVLTVTPLRAMLGMPSLARFRRMLGLFVFFYICLHLLGYAWFDKEFDIPEIAKDIAKRPFILVGFLGFVLLTPLALTSFNKAIKWMGAKRRARIILPRCLCMRVFWRCFWDGVSGINSKANECPSPHSALHSAPPCFYIPSRY